jgi:hypothetical protein
MINLNVSLDYNQTDYTGTCISDYRRGLDW